VAAAEKTSLEDIGSTDKFRENKWVLKKKEKCFPRGVQEAYQVHFSSRAKLKPRLWATKEHTREKKKRPLKKHKASGNRQYLAERRDNRLGPKKEARHVKIGFEIGGKIQPRCGMSQASN